MLCGWVLACWSAIGWAASGKAVDATDHAEQHAEQALMEGRVDEAIALLMPRIAEKDIAARGEAQLLLCRAFFSEQHIGEAVHACESAINALPKDSSAQDWLGRAYGAKANSLNPFVAMKMAPLVRQAFEAAVALDPHSAAAAGDLAEYYVGAPQLVGGGTYKALALANRIEADLPQTAHRIRGLVAEKNKDYATAEREFMAEVNVAHDPKAWVDLGGYYVGRQDTRKAVDALQHALAADSARGPATAGPATVDAASYLIDMHTGPELAARALRQYLAGSARSDAAPAAHVYVLLGNLLAAAGDRNEARMEYRRALVLASKYAPAQRALQGM